MTDTRVERRLSAVLAADVVGYSRLMGADEAGTLARLKAARPIFAQAAAQNRQSAPTRANTTCAVSIGPFSAPITAAPYRPTPQKIAW